MTELWKDIEGYEGLYQVSNMGRVRSLDRIATAERNGKTIQRNIVGKLLTPTKRRHGYLAVMLYGRGGHPTRGFKSVSVHRLVASAFVDNPHGYGEVNHLDENKQNNAADNLEWCDRKYNTNYGTTQERRAEKIRNNPARSRQIAQKELDGELVKIWPSLQEIRRQTGYSPSNICRCCQGDKNYSRAYGYKWEYS